MTDPGSLLQEPILRVLEVTPRGLTVERIRTRLFEAGATVGKHEIVRELGRMNERQRVEYSAARGWSVRRHPLMADKTGLAASHRPDEG